MKQKTNSPIPTTLKRKGKFFSRVNELSENAFGKLVYELRNKLEKDGLKPPASFRKFVYEAAEGDDRFLYEVNEQYSKSLEELVNTVDKKLKDDILILREHERINEITKPLRQKIRDLLDIRETIIEDYKEAPTGAKKVAFDDVNKELEKLKIDTTRFPSLPSKLYKNLSQII